MCVQNECFLTETRWRQSSTVTGPENKRGAPDTSVCEGTTLPDISGVVDLIPSWQPNFKLINMSQLL